MSAGSYPGRETGARVHPEPASVQNHDHIGNSARGERLAALAGPAVQRLGASLMLLSPYLPLLFMGEEYGETSPSLFFCTFAASRLSLSWPEGTPRAGLRRLYRDLLSARRRWPALGDFVSRRARLLPDPSAGPVLELVRGADPGASLHASFNLSADPQPLPARVPAGIRVVRSTE